MNIKFLYVLVLYLGPNYLLCQDFNNYYPLKCLGEIPDEIKISSRLKSQVLIDQIERSGKTKRQLRREKEFYVLSQYETDYILRSGKILYNDPISKYIERIADTLLSADHDLRSKIRFYIIRSPDINAYSTNNGCIFICMGLLCRVTNEAQIAFILAHEISHYKLKHALASYTQRNNVVDSAIYFSEKSYKTRVENIFKYSRETEIAADLEGLRMFQRLNYARTAPSEVMDILKNSNTPYQNLSFNIKQWEDSLYKLPASFFPDTNYLEIPPDDFGRNPYASHPSLEARKANLNSHLDLKEGNKYLISTEEFNLIQKYARHEITYYYINTAQYSKAMYYAYLLKELYSENSLFTDRVTAMSLFGIVKHKNYNKSIGTEYQQKIHYFIGGNSNGDSELQKLEYFLNQIPANEFNILAVRSINSIYAKTHDIFIYRLLASVTKDLVANHNLFFSNFITYDELKTNMNAAKAHDYYYFGLIDFLKNSDSHHLLDSINSDIQNDTLLTIENNLLNKIRINTDTLIMMRTNIEWLRDKQRDFIKDEIISDSVNKMYQKIASSVGIKVQVLDPSDKDFNTNNYNQMSQLSFWLTENSINNHISDVIMFEEAYNNPTSKDNKMMAMANFYGSSNHRTPFLFLPVPIYIYLLIKPKHRLYYKYSLIDISENQVYDLLHRKYKRRGTMRLYRKIIFKTFKSKQIA